MRVRYPVVAACLLLLGCTATPDPSIPSPPPNASHPPVATAAPPSARKPDPLMGWSSSDDTQSQVVLSFDTQEEAVAYAQRHGIPFQLIPPAEQRKIIKAYADNFAYNRKEPWTH